jgi:hypothetical protein
MTADEYLRIPRIMGSLKTVSLDKRYLINADGTVIICQAFTTAHGHNHRAKYASVSRPSGYRYLRATIGRSKCDVHRLVAITWIGPPPFLGAYVLHKDDNPDNNHYTNLYWGTQKQNTDDALRNGHRPQGEKMYNSKRTNEEVAYIKFLLQTKHHREVAKIVGEHWLFVWKIKQRQIWRSVQPSDKEPLNDYR